MTLRQLEYRIQLKDAVTGQSIITSGGKVYVATAGSPAKQAILDADGASMTNPMTPTRGFINFFTAETVGSVDLYIQAPGGQFLVVDGVAASGPNEVLIDTSNRNQTMVIPFSIDDTTATTETDTGFTEPTSSVFLPTPMLNVITLDATDDIDVGTLSTDSGDADGFLDAASVANAGIVLGEVGFTVGTNSTIIDLTGGDAEFTLGALFCAAGTKVAKSEGSDVAIDGNGIAIPVPHIGAGKAITYTLSAGTDTAEGFVHLPYQLLAA